MQPPPAAQRVNNLPSLAPYVPIVERLNLVCWLKIWPSITRSSLLAIISASTWAFSRMQNTGKFPIVNPGAFGHFPEIMEDIEDHFARLIEARLNELGESAYAFEQKMGWPADALRSVLRKDAKKARPNLGRVQTLCDALGLELYIGTPRTPSPSDEPAGVAAQDFARVPVYDAFLSAGDGFDNAEQMPSDYMVFKKDHLRKLGVSIHSAVIAKVSGKSMLPTIFPGDHVLIDTSRRTVEPRTQKMWNTRKNRPPVYAFVADGQARVKRMIGSAEKGVRVWSDNPLHDPEYLTPEEFSAIHVIGRVMWWGHNDA